MAALKSFLENLRPGGASNIPKSLFQQNLTEDSELDSTENIEVNPKVTVPETKTEIQKKPRKGLTKQLATIDNDSSEFVEINLNDHNKNSKETKEASLRPDVLPRHKKIPKVSESQNEHLEKIWQDLKVGEDGYLTLLELEKVCSHLGMNNLDQNDLKNLFIMIDTDHDGRVSFDEFVTGLKEYQKTKTNPAKGSGSGLKSSDLSNGSASGLFTTLDPCGEGICEAKNVVDYWASGGLLNGSDVLEYFNLNLNERINLLSLSNGLELEITMADLDAVVLAGIISYQKELHYWKSLQKMMLNTGTKSDNQGSNQEMNSDLISQQEISKAALEKQRNEYELLIVELGKNKTDLQNRLAMLNEELSVLRFETTEHVDRIKNLEEINVRQTEELDAVADLHRKMELELKIYRDNTDLHGKSQLNSHELENKFLLSENKVLNLENQLSKKIHECEELEKNIADLNTKFESQLDSLTNQFLVNGERKEEKIEELKLQHSMNTSIDGKRIKKLEDDNESLRKKLKSLNTKIEIAVNRENQYQIKLKDREKDEEKINELEERLSELMDQCSEYEKKMDELNEQIKNLEKEKRQGIKSLQNLENEFHDSKITLQNENETLARKCKMLDNHMNQLSHLKSENASCRDDIRSKEVLIEKLEQANDRLSISVTNAVSKLEMLSKNDFHINPKQLMNENIQIQKENLLLENELNQIKRKSDFGEKSQTSESEIKNLQMKIKEKNYKIEELEEKLRRDRASPSSYNSQKTTFRKYDQLQFQYDELKKKYQLQLDQVDKTDELLKELYEGNTKLLKSLNHVEEQKEKAEMTVIRLEAKVVTLQNVLNRSDIS